MSGVVQPRNNRVPRQPSHRTITVEELLRRVAVFGFVLRRRHPGKRCKMQEGARSSPRTHTTRTRNHGIPRPPGPTHDRPRHGSTNVRRALRDLLRRALPPPPLERARTYTHRHHRQWVTAAAAARTRPVFFLSFFSLSTGARTICFRASESRT